MELVLFLYIIGWLIGVGAELENTNNDEPALVIYVGNLVVWPLSIGKAISRRA